MAHIPERTCLACGRKTNKAELLRIAFNNEGNFTIDPAQRLPGRGAYVCRMVACGEALKKKKGLHRSFHRPIPFEVYERVIEFLRPYAS